MAVETGVVLITSLSIGALRGATSRSRGPDTLKAFATLAGASGVFFASDSYNSFISSRDAPWKGRFRPVPVPNIVLATSGAVAVFTLFALPGFAVGSAVAISARALRTTAHRTASAKDKC